MNSATIRLLLFAAALWLPGVAAPAESAEAPRRPTQYAIIFNMGYAADAFPEDADAFERVVTSVKKAHFNTIWCKYTDERAEVCRRHGMKIMVDLLVPEHHVYKNPDGARALCERLRESDVVYAYHLWSDRIGGTIEGRSRDVANVRRWDPNHPTYVGSYHARAIADLKDADLIGYYDFHWLRGGHFRHLFRILDAAGRTDALFLRYTHSDPGRVGIGNYNRVLYTVATANAFGQKGYTYHYVGGTIDANTGEWGPLMKDLARVNAEVAKLGPELIKIGNPIAVYSTPITRTAKDDPVDTLAVPAEFQPVPPDHWFRVARGEAIVGLFRGEGGRDALVLANHNAYQAQGMSLEFRVPLKSVRLFDRRQGEWTELDIAGRRVEFPIPPAACELLHVPLPPGNRQRFERGETRLGDGLEPDTEGVEVGIALDGRLPPPAGDGRHDHQDGDACAKHDTARGAAE